MAGAIPINPGDALKMDEAQESGTYSDQCYLLDYIDVLSNYNACNGGGYKNFIPINTSDGSGAFEIISKLASRTGLKELTNIRPADIALLQPKVRISKCIYDTPDAQFPTIREIPFPEFINPSDIREIIETGGGGRQRTGGAGLKEFSWTFAGTNPAEAEKLIEVQMKLSFQSAEDLLGKSYNHREGVFDPAGFTLDKPEFIDLIRHPPTKDQIKEANRRTDVYVGKMFRIKAEVGWNIPEADFPTLSSRKSEDLKAMLRTCTLSMYLNLVQHEFSLKENGSIELSIDYVGSLETAIDGNAANILAAAKALNDPSMAFPGSGRVYTTSQWNALAKRQEMEREIEQNRNDIADMQEQEECASQLGLGSAGSAFSRQIEQKAKINKKKLEVLNKLHSVNRETIYKAFMETLKNSGKIKMLGDLSSNTVKRWEESLISKNRVGSVMGGGRPKLSTDSIQPDRNGGGTKKFTKALKKVGQAQKKGNKKGAEKAASDFSSEAQKQAKSSDKRRLFYLYFGDLLEIACECLKPELNRDADNMAVLTGPVVINHPRDNSTIRFNLADLPISLDLFLGFFMDTVVKKQKDTYPLKQFIKDVLEKLVRPSLKPSTCFQGNKEQRNIEIGQTMVTIHDRTYQMLKSRSSNGPVNISRISGNSITPLTGEEHGHQCMLLYLTSYSASDLRGNPARDRQKGIFHYTIGQDVGLLRKMEFKRSDVQGLREARQANDRNLGQLRDVYNASITLVGNNIYIPGMKVFLNPPYGFGSPLKRMSLSHVLGIGGYYDVIKVNSTISRGGAYTTDLDLIFAQSGAPVESTEEKCEKILGKQSMQNLNDLESAFDEAAERFGFDDHSDRNPSGGSC